MNWCTVVNELSLAVTIMFIFASRFDRHRLCYDVACLRCQFPCFITWVFTWRCRLCIFCPIALYNHSLFSLILCHLILYISIYIVAVHLQLFADSLTVDAACSRMSLRRWRHIWHIWRAQFGNQALIIAGYHGRADCVRLLLDAGADTEVKENVRASRSAADRS